MEAMLTSSSTEVECDGPVDDNTDSDCNDEFCSDLAQVNIISTTTNTILEKENNQCQGERLIGGKQSETIQGRDQGTRRNEPHLNSLVGNIKIEDSQGKGTTKVFEDEIVKEYDSPVSHSPTKHRKKSVEEKQNASSECFPVI